jgi:hypothetical protein
VREMACVLVFCFRVVILFLKLVKKNEGFWGVFFIKNLISQFLENKLNFSTSGFNRPTI